MTEQSVHSRAPVRPGAGRRTAAPPREFLGRRGELAALRADTLRAGLDTLAGRPAPRSRVLLIVGRPGTGRTALAEEFTRQRRADGDFPDGVLRARLTDPGGGPVPTERTARDLLGALGHTPPPGAGEDEMTEALRAALAARGVVLLLDDVCTADQLVELVPDSPDSLVVAVARGPLTGVPDVRPCTVGALDQQAAVTLLTRGAGATRVTVDPRATEALAETCAHLPAALMLAGGWLAAHPDAAVADARRRLLELPESGSDGVGDALDRAFRLSCSRLPALSARMLRLLALAPAGLADAHTAAALAGCSTTTARTTLEGFAQLGLVRTVQAEPAGTEEPTGPLYAVPGCLDPLLQARLRDDERVEDVLLARARMLERTVRQLLSCHAVTEERGSPAREWLAELPASLRFASRAAAASWLESRLGALLAAARLVVAGGELDTLARRLIAALTAALTAHRGAAGAAPELYRLHELVLDIADRQRLPRERAAALLHLGDLDAGTGRLDTALERYRGALETLRAEGERADPGAVGRAVESIGGTHAERGAWQQAADWYSRALSLAQSRGDLDDEARLHARLGAVLSRDEQWGAALRSWRAAAAAHRRRGDGAARARAVAQAARVEEYAGHPEDAERTAREALRIAERTDDRRLQAALLLRLADCAERLGRLADAAVHRAAAERLLPADERGPHEPAATEPGTADGAGPERVAVASRPSQEGTATTPPVAADHPDVTGRTCET